MRSYAQQKAALTRAEKRGPGAVIDEVRRTYAEWDEAGPWPDGWNRWNRAQQDAEYQLARENWRM